MSASKENTLDLVRIDGADAITVTGTRHALAGLSRQNLLKAANLAFPEVKGNLWFRVKSVDVLRAISSGVAPDFTTMGEGEAPTDKQINYLHALQKRAGVPITTPADKAEAAREIDRLQTILAPGEDDTPEAVKAAQAAHKAPATPAPSGGTVDEAVAALVASLAPRGSEGVDAEAVRAIVAEEVANLAPRRIVVEARGEVRDVPGAVHEAFDEVLDWASDRESLMLVGEAGSGKSTLAVQVFTALGLEARGISVGPTTPTSKLFGFMDAHGNPVRTPLWDAYEYGMGFLVDEVDNGHPGLLTELNQLLANGEAAFAGGQVKRHPNFVCIATANTYGRGGDRLFVGRNVLDAAFLDRFVPVDVNVDEALERTVALAYATDETADKAAKWVAKVQAARRAVADAKLPLVISPRASIRGCKALARGKSLSYCTEALLLRGKTSDHRKLLENA